MATKTIYQVYVDIGCDCWVLPTMFDDYESADAAGKDWLYDAYAINDIQPDEYDDCDICYEVIEKDVVYCEVCGDICQLPNGDLTSCKSCAKQME